MDELLVSRLADSNYITSRTCSRLYFSFRPRIIHPPRKQHRATGPLTNDEKERMIRDKNHPGIGTAVGIITAPVAAAASVPSSSTKIYALCTTSDKNNRPLPAIPEKHDVTHFPPGGGIHHLLCTKRYLGCPAGKNGVPKMRKNTGIKVPFPGGE